MHSILNIKLFSFFISLNLFSINIFEFNFELRYFSVLKFYELCKACLYRKYFSEGKDFIWLNGLYLNWTFGIDPDISLSICMFRIKWEWPKAFYMCASTAEMRSNLLKTSEKNRDWVFLHMYFSDTLNIFTRFLFFLKASGMIRTSNHWRIH